MKPGNKGDWGKVTVVLTNVRRIALAVTLVFGCAAMVAGCGMPTLGGLLGAKPGGGITPQTVSEQSLLDAAKSDGTDVGGDAGMAMACPQFEVWPSTQTLTTYENGRVGDGGAIVNRGEITQTARECQVSGGHVVIRYGFSGRVLLGPRGVAGHVSLPVNIVLTDSQKQRVQGDSLRVEVDISDGKPIGYFSTVRSITFDVPEGARAADYKLYVAFDKAPGSA